MTKLKTFRRQLATLRRWRGFVRWATAHTGLLMAVLWVLVAIFVIDVGFEMDIAQRLVVMAAGAGVTVWAYRRYTFPLLGTHEDDVEVALLVERQQRIDSDLVAALQFESPEATAWGSRQLEDAVIDRVAGLGRTLDVFEGFSREQMARRGAMLVISAGIIGAFVCAYPDYAGIFTHRLLLGKSHYPSATRIEHVIVNRRSVLLRERGGTAPSPIKSAEGHPVAFLVQCSGRLPDRGTAELSSDHGHKRSVELERLTLAQRRRRLEEAATRIRQAVENRDVDVAGPWTDETNTLIRFDAPEAAALVDEAGVNTARLLRAAERIDKRLSSWPGNADDTALYVGRLTRLVDSVTYQLYLGDAWTDPAKVDMIPLPVVEPIFTPVPPDYARAAPDVNVKPSARHLSVLEGSELKVTIECTNKKRLTKAWLTVAGEGEARQYPLTQEDNDGYRWTLATRDTPFSRIDHELRFEIQVTDEDGLHLQTPIRGYIRIRADRPPTCTAGIVHRVVLPTAKPTIEYRCGDDYGIARLAVHVQIERGQNDSEPILDERQTLSLLDNSDPLTTDVLPLVGTYEFDLAALQIEEDGRQRPAELAKDDRLKLTLEAIDYQGDAPGQSYMSDPLVLEISDEAGVLAAISEADERSEQRLTDIIKQQLGIGNE